MKKLMVCALASLLLWQSAAADEGMWMIYRLGRDVYSQMCAKGLKLKQKELFDEQTPALYDAVVAIDGGMGTGSLISDQGLMITNHHVAFSDICALSTPEHNYLETGFWARMRGDEIPVPGKSVSFLRKVVDVTTEVQQIKAEIVAAGKWGPMAMRRLYGQIEGRYQKQTPYEVSCASMWGGEQFLMFFYEIYTDVRLVGTPPVSIGAFGGDADNWSWPQHKGDFTLYRIYADAQGRPAKYSADNVPLKPRRALSIATGGVHDGDFSMVIGFPGRTNRYNSSFAVEEKQLVRNPVVVANRHDRMDIIKAHMEQNAEVRMKYSDAYFGLSNYADFAKWENKCLCRFCVVGIRAEEERRMQRWIEADPARKVEYGTLLADMQRGFASRRDAMRNLVYFQETCFGASEALLMANRVSSYLSKLDRLKMDTLDVTQKDAHSVVTNAVRLRDNYDAATDRDLLARMMVNFTKDVPRDLWGETLVEMYGRCGGDADRMAREAFDASFCSDAARYAATFAQNRSVMELHRDPLVALNESIRVMRFKDDVNKAERAAGVDVDKLEASYVKALYDFRMAEGVAQYPNANSTMRLTYGQVEPVSPADGVHCDSRSTVQGYLEKYNPTDYNFRVDARMRGLIAAKDWGRWGEKGRLYVNFLTNNDITGGNSGSPVLDGQGRLIGLAFDGNRESMANDVYFQPECSKTVCVDIRYVMWVIEKYADAGFLLDELKFEK